MSEVWLPRGRPESPYSASGRRRNHADARPIEILLVEDNPGDVRLTIEALRDGKVSNHLSVAHDGVEALAFVRRECNFAAAPRPDLILLDLNLPGKDGHEVLAEIKPDPELREIPVVVMTTSRAEQDMLRARQLEVRAYVTKPLDLRQFIDVIESIKDFWLRCGCPTRAIGVPAPRRLPLG